MAQVCRSLVRSLWFAWANRVLFVLLLFSFRRVIHLIRSLSYFSVIDFIKYVSVFHARIRSARVPTMDNGIRCLVNSNNPFCRVGDS
ncbi:hypothetical protein BS17DRAFT_401087 [Gyrodon lividus]|nr:hypothetical protein BS17DRAFT_401087 [Gyrodon lividus]